MCHRLASAISDIEKLYADIHQSAVIDSDTLDTALSVVHCSRPVAVVEVPQVSLQEKLAERGFDAIDLNNDGVIDRAEWEHAMSGTPAVKPKSSHAEKQLVFEQQEAEKQWEAEKRMLEQVQTSRLGSLNMCV